MKKTARKMTLHRETLFILESSELRVVPGGAAETQDVTACAGACADAQDRAFQAMDGYVRG